MVTIKRRVIQIAGSTQLVSLPRKWAIKNNIKKGDEIDVIEDGDKIIVSANDVKKSEKVKLDINNYKLFVLRAVASLYKSGYDEVELKFDDFKLVKDLPQQINELLPGFEVLDQTTNSLLIKSVATEDNAEFDSALRRIFIVTVAMGRNIFEILENFDKPKISSIMQLEMTNNRFCNFCERLLNKKGFKDHKKVTFVYNIVWELEKIGDQFKYICLFLDEHEKNIKPNKDIIELAKKTNKNLESFYELFYKFNQNLVAEIADSRKEIVEKSNQLFTQKLGNEIKILHHLVNVNQMIFNMVGSYLGVVIKPEEVD